MNWKVLFFSLLLLGCTSTVTPTLSGDPQVWRNYGEQQATVGELKLSQEKLAQHALSGSVNADQYQAYLDGYQVGQKVYCDQDPRWLARAGKPYLGACDDINPFFRTDYDNTLYENW